MFEEKLLIGIASLASTVAIVAVLVVVPSLYATINETHDIVMDTVKVLFFILRFYFYFVFRFSVWRPTPPGRQ